MTRKILKVIKKPQLLFLYILSFRICEWLPDSLYLKMVYRLRIGKKLNLKNPVTFNEKLQWLKLHDRKPEYTVMVDKFAVRKYIADKIGEQYLIPLLGVWDSPEEINFNALPDQFVLKCNHNSGLGMCICKDKSTLNIEQVKKELKKGLRQNFYKHGREWPYKDVKRKIIAERYMEDKQSKQDGMIDYKFYCFNGEPKFLYVSTGLDNCKTARISFVSLDWKKMEFYRTDYMQHEQLPPKPEMFDQMLEICKKLSFNMPFLRVDLYQIKGQIYFSVLTFSPCCGMMPFNSDEWDEKLGALIDLHAAQ